MRRLETVLAEHAFFKGMEPDHLSFIAGCGSNARFEEGEYIFHEGEPANLFFLIRHGKVTLETFVPGRGPLVIQTIGEGDVLGWSWLVPPYRWAFDARALELTRAVALDGACLRAKCQEDNRLGYELMQRVAHIITQRLQATMLQLIDVYGHASKS